MMPAVSACPDRQVFVHFLQGKLSVAEVLRLEEHLGQCEPCRGVLQAAAAQQPPPPPALNEASSAVHRVLSRYCTRTASSASLESTRDDLPSSGEMASALE